MSRPKIFVRPQSSATRNWLRQLIWLHVSNPFHSTPAPVPMMAPTNGTSNTARSLPTYAADPLCL